MHLLDKAAPYLANALYLGAGAAAGLFLYALATWGRAPSALDRTQKHERHIRLNEPLLPQLWRFLRVMTSGRTATSAFGSFFDSKRVAEHLEEAMYPWGLKTPNDVYAIGIPIGILITTVFWYMSGMWIVLLTLPMFLGAGVGLMVVALKVIAKGTRQAQIQELWLLLSGMEIYLGAKYTLYDSLREASGACVLLRGPIEKCLLEWGSVGASTALDNLSKTLKLPEAYMVISAIRQASDLDPANLAGFMMREGHRLDKTMEAQQSRSRQIKPMLQNATMAVPMFNVFAMWTFPLAYSIFARMGDVGM